MMKTESLDKEMSSAFRTAEQLIGTFQDQAQAAGLSSDHKGQLTFEAAAFAAGNFFRMASGSLKTEPLNDTWRDSLRAALEEIGRNVANMLPDEHQRVTRRDFERRGGGQLIQLLASTKLAIQSER